MSFAENNYFTLYIPFLFPDGLISFWCIQFFFLFFFPMEQLDLI